MSATYQLTPSGSTRRSANSIEVKMNHNVYCDKVVVTIEATAMKFFPPFPRVGVRMRCDKHLSSVEWFGRGPHECYPDRKSSAIYGRHASTSHEMHVPYIVPSENGGRSDVSWIAFHNQNVTPSSMRNHADRRHRAMVRALQGDIPMINTATTGLLVTMPHCSAAQVSAQHHALEALCAASHTHELEEMTGKGDGSVHLHVDHLHMGVGGDDSWTPSVHSQFMIPPGNLWSWSFTLAPVLPGIDAFVVHNRTQSQQ